MLEISQQTIHSEKGSSPPHEGDILMLTPAWINSRLWRFIKLPA
jgi:hypothetical protein